MFLTEIRVPFDAKGGVYAVLNKRKGQILEEESI